MYILPTETVKVLYHKTVFSAALLILNLFSHIGWEGSATDARVYESALSDGLVIPEGKYYLADAGFPSCKELLISYRSTWYHLAEWGCAENRYVFSGITTFLFIYCSYTRPLNKEELFNHRHAMARNVIERIFGVLKRCFRILLLAPEYSLEIQARIPAALCSIHNFIRVRTHASDKPEDEDLFGTHYGNHRSDPDRIAEAAALMPDEPCARRDQIAQQMWDDYDEIRNERDHNPEALEDEDNGDEDDSDGDEDKDDDGNPFEDDDEVEHDHWPGNL